MRKVLQDLDFASIVGLDLNTNELIAFSLNTKSIFRRKGEKIFSAGDRDDKFYLIVRGKVAFSVPRGDRPREM